MDPRHLLRLGSGETDLRESLAKGSGGRGTGEEFSKQGRVNWSLARRIQLLGQVQRLAGCLGVAGDVGYTCETAAYFQLEHVQSRIERFTIEAKGQGGWEVPRLFPFTEYFSDAPQPLFTGTCFFFALICYPIILT